MKDAESYILAVMQGERGIVPALLRGVLSILSLVYNAGLELYLLPYNVGIRKRARLPCPVICIGNLTTGGTGKTPTTQTVCRLLQAQGKRVVVLNRGYGGQNEYRCAIVSDGETVLLNAEQAGDEAFLLASTLENVPVVVGKDRRVTGKLAWEQFHPDAIVLDDGMQFWQLHRDLDVVLLNAAMPFDNGWTLPRGLLREPKSHLRRAGIILLTGAEQTAPAIVNTTETEAKRLAPNAPIFRGDLAPIQVKAIASGETFPVEWLRGRNMALLSAIGNPAGFAALLESLGAKIKQEFVFRDHHAVTQAEWENVCREAQNAGANDGIVITEKDAVKLPKMNCELPVYSLAVRMQIENEAEFLSALLSELGFIGLRD